MARTNPPSLLLLLSSAAMAVFLLSATIAAAFEFKVGDEMGWQVPPANNSGFYSYWAAINRFQVGDSLSFEYKNDSVLMVEKWDFYHCNSSDPIVAFNNGKGVMKLDRSGSFYFISGSFDHCKEGQRLVVEVMSPHSVSPPEAAASPEGYASAAPSPTPNSGGVVWVTGSTVLIVFMAAGFGMLSCAG